MAKTKGNVKAKKKKCKAGWQCGKGCISRKKTCRKNLKNLKGKFIAQTYADYVAALSGGGGSADTPAPAPAPASKGYGDMEAARITSNPAKHKEITDPIVTGRRTTDVEPRELTQGEAEAIKELIPQRPELENHAISANSVSDRLRYAPDNESIVNMSQKRMGDMGDAIGIGGSIAYVTQLKEAKNLLDPKDPLQKAFDIMIANGEQRVLDLWEKAEPSTRVKVAGQILVNGKLKDIGKATDGLLQWQE